MKDVKIKTQFIELRALGWSLRRIATQLGISTSCVMRWNRQFKVQIQELQALEMEALQEKLLATREERARGNAEQLRLVHEEQQKRSLADLSTTRLYLLEDCLQRRIIRDTTPGAVIKALDEPEATEAVLDHEEAVLENERRVLSRQNEKAELAQYYGVSLEDLRDSVEKPPVQGAAAPGQEIQSVQAGKE